MRFDVFSGYICLHALIDGSSEGIPHLPHGCCLECVLESVCKCLEVLLSPCVFVLFLPTKCIVFTSVNIAWWSDMPGRISILFTRFGLFVVMRSRMLFSRVAV